MIYLLLILAFIPVFSILSEEKTAKNTTPTYEPPKTINILSDEIELEEFEDSLLQEVVRHYNGWENKHYAFSYSYIYATFNGVTKKVYFYSEDVKTILGGRELTSVKLVINEQSHRCGAEIILGVNAHF